MAKVTDAQLRQIMLLVYEGVTGHPFSEDRVQRPAPPKPRRRPVGDRVSEEFLAEFAAWRRAQKVA